MEEHQEDLARLADRLRATFPQLDGIAPLRVLGSGFRSRAVETADGVVFRVAQNAAAAAGYRKEVALLPALQPHLPVPVPNPPWYAPNAPTFPFGVIGYRTIAAVPLQFALLPHLDHVRLSEDGARFLRALHRLPTAALEPILPPSDPAAWQLLRADLRPVLRSALTAPEYRTVAAWWERLLADPLLRDYTPVVRHGDLWYGNMLVDLDRRLLVGVIDWEEAALGDPAQDFATLLHGGSTVTEQVIRVYKAAGGVLDATFRHRLQRLWELREFDGLCFAVQHHDVEEFEDALQKIRRGPIFNDAMNKTNL